MSSTSGTIFKRVGGSGETQKSKVTETSMVRVSSEFGGDEDYPTDFKSPKHE